MLLRPYTPVTEVEQPGFVDFVIKVGALRTGADAVVFAEAGFRDWCSAFASSADACIVAL